MSVSPLIGRPAPAGPTGNWSAPPAARVRRPPDPRRAGPPPHGHQPDQVAAAAGVAACCSACSRSGRSSSAWVDSARIAYQRASSEIGGAVLTDAHYHGVDEHGRPYTVTAATARADRRRSGST